MGMKRSYYQRLYHETLIFFLFLLAILCWTTLGFVLPDRPISVHWQKRVLCQDQNAFNRVTSLRTRLPQRWGRQNTASSLRSTNIPLFSTTEQDDETKFSAVSEPPSRQQLMLWLRRLCTHPKWIRLVSFWQRITNESILAQACIAIVLYLFHLTVLTQHLAIFAWNYIAIGYDSLLGCIVFMIYFVNRWKERRRPTSEESTVPWNLPRPPPQVSSSTTNSVETAHVPSNSTTAELSLNSVWNWLRSNRPFSSPEFAWIQFRISMMITIATLVKAYFQTGTYSLFWEDLLYSMSAAGWPLTIPLSRSIQVLAGHLTWVTAGSIILWALPRPPPFFRRSVPHSNSIINGSDARNAKDPPASSYQWFQMSLRKCNWLWWTIGGYFVSSWLFNIADTMNRYILPAQVLQDAAESVVTQLVQPEHNDLWASAIGYIAPCVTAPVWEELLYRGFLLAGLTAWTGSWHFSCILQAILFSAHHMSVTAALPLAVLGYTWAVLYTHSQNLWTVIAVHAMWNSRVFFGSWFGL